MKFHCIPSVSIEFKKVYLQLTRLTKLLGNPDKAGPPTVGAVPGAPETETE